MTFEETSGVVKMNEDTTMFEKLVKPFTMDEIFSLYARRLSHLLTLNRIQQNSANIFVLVSLGEPELYKALTSIIAPKKETDAYVLYERNIL